ncbi:XrtY-associated glycosyltransferase XYAG1 [Pedobacter mucosus]|uniref:XrtY-associated glycosyltransferase XYAG1 n=1 Tax=Pedobacter mucosus TaxID=2895286 RepID=UPI001EE4E4EA|nr:glycosyltransferase [Pedobacter mucosus]UKT64381.1 glycosyltransferase [Pedobacter mucosus]
MKIIHITASYKPAYIYGGPIQSVGKLCEALERIKDQGAKSKEQRAKTKGQELKCKEQGSKIKDSLQVFTTTANGTEELDVEIGKPLIVDGVSVTYFNRWTKDHSHFSPSLLKSLRNEILRCTQDDNLIIHIHSWWNLVSVLSCLIAKFYNIPVVLSPRGMLTSYTQHNRNTFLKKTLHHLVGKKLLSYCHIHATSEQEEKEILKIAQPKSITIIPNLVKLRGKKPQEKNLDSDVIEKLNLIFLSRIEEKKGLPLLFNALAILDISWSLTIAGSGEPDYVDSLKLIVKSLEISDRIKWIGQIEDDKKFDLMAAHDLLVLTSYNENFANVVIECLSVGTAVLISDKVGLADYVTSKDFGWVTPLDIHDIKNSILAAYYNREKLLRISNSAPTAMEVDYNDEILVNRYLSMYKSTLNV